MGCTMRFQFAVSISEADWNLYTKCDMRAQYDKIAQYFIDTRRISV